MLTVGENEHTHFIDTCSPRGTALKISRPGRNWENTALVPILDEGAVPTGMYEELLQLIKRQRTRPPKWATGFNRPLPKENVQTDSKQTQRCSTLLVTREIQTTTRHHYHSPEKLEINSPEPPNTRKNMQQVELPHVAGGCMRCCGHSEKWLVSS